MKIKFVIFMSSLYAASVGHAEGFYAVGSVGQSRFDSSHHAAKQALDSNADQTVDGVRGEPSRFDNLDTGAKAQLGYAINQNFAVEGGYVDLGKQHYDVNYTTGAGHGSVGATGWNLDAVGTLPITQELSVFGKVGAIDADVKSHIRGSDLGGTMVDSHESHQWSPNFGVGASYAVADNVSTRLEVERFANVGEAHSTGRQDIDLVSVGMAYRFN